MGEASAVEVGPFFPVINRLQGALHARSDRLLEWSQTPQGRFAEIVGGRLHLEEFPQYAKLTVIYESTSDAGDGPRTIERGRRIVSTASAARAQRKAFDLATHGVRSGPTFTEGSWVWDRVDLDSSLRMVVPRGELRISCPEDGTCVLTHENVRGVELLAKEGEAELERQAIGYWQTRTDRPLRVIVKGRTVHLRSLEVPGLIGYYPVTDNRFVALVRDGDAFALLDVEGCYPRLFVKISWDQALSGEPFNVDELLAAARRGAANHGPAANKEFVNTQPAETAAYNRAPAPPTTTASQSPPEAVVGTRPRAPCPPGYTPMSEPHRALCQRYLKRLYRRLRGRGGRKARDLVLILLEALERCRRDITGTRQEVHSELERVLGRALSGGDRNIRDCLDLLVKCSLLVRREEGTRCTFLFGQLHDPDSELMRRIAAEETAEEARGEVNMVAPPRATADTNQDRNHEHPEPTLGEPKLTAPAPGSATTPESATGSARSAGLQVDAGIVAHSPDSTIESRKQSAYIFQALVTPIPSLPLQQHERGVPIIPKGRLATTIDTSLRGFTDVATSRVEPSEPGGKKDDQGSS